MSIKLSENVEIELIQIYMPRGDSLHVILNRKFDHSISVHLKVLPHGGCELIWNDGKKTESKVWYDPETKEQFQYIKKLENKP